MRRFDEQTAYHTHGCHVHATAAEDVDGSQGFKLFKARGEKFVYFCHDIFPYVNEKP